MLICCYAPTNVKKNAAATELFYQQLQQTLDNTDNNDQVILGGDWNAQVGADHRSLPSVMGHFGIGNLNSNGQKLLKYVNINNLMITNTFFNHRNIYNTRGLVKSHLQVDDRRKW